MYKLNIFLTYQKIETPPYTLIARELERKTEIDIGLESMPYFM